MADHCRIYSNVNRQGPNILFILLSLSTLLWKLQIHIHSLFLGTGFRGIGWIFPVRSRSFRDSVASSPKSRKSSRDLASTFRSSDFNSEKNTRRFKNLKKMLYKFILLCSFQAKISKKVDYFADEKSFLLLLLFMYYRATDQVCICLRRQFKFKNKQLFHKSSVRKNNK